MVDKTWQNWKAKQKQKLIGFILYFLFVLYFSAIRSIIFYLESFNYFNLIFMSGIFFLLATPLYYLLFVKWKHILFKQSDKIEIKDDNKATLSLELTAVGKVFFTFLILELTLSIVLKIYGVI